MTAQEGEDLVQIAKRQGKGSICWAYSPISFGSANRQKDASGRRTRQTSIYLFKQTQSGQNSTRRKYSLVFRSTRYFCNSISGWRRTRRCNSNGNEHSPSKHCRHNYNQYEIFLRDWGAYFCFLVTPF